MKKLEILFLNQKDMKDLNAASVEAALQDVKTVYSFFNWEKETRLTIPDKVVLRFGKTQYDEHKNGRINAMPGRIHGGGYDIAGIKWIGSGPDNKQYGYPRANAIVILNDPVTKLPLCIADGTSVSAARTGACGGVAMELLSRKDSSVFTICGAGVQGRTQLKAATLVRPNIKKVYIYDTFRSASEQFKLEVELLYPQIRFEVIKLDGLENSIRESDVVITVTTADIPFIKAGWTKKGALLMNMAGDEMEHGCITSADKVIVDFWNSIKHRNSSSIAHLVNNNPQYHNFMPNAELGEILNHTKPGRENDNEIIYFNAVGAGVLDLMIVNRCYQQAKKIQKGQTLLFWDGD